MAPEAIAASYGRHPMDEEEAVQDGLIQWAQGYHANLPTWRVLLGAMVFAGVAQQHHQALREALYRLQMSTSECVCMYMCAVCGNGNSVNFCILSIY